MFEGFVIPYVQVVQGDGAPEVGKIDPERLQRVQGERRCQMCGKKIGKKQMLVFIGGDASRITGFFEGGAMHEECALYLAEMVKLSQRLNPSKDGVALFAVWSYVLKKNTKGQVFCFVKKFEKVVWVVKPPKENNEASTNST